MSPLQPQLIGAAGPAHPVVQGRRVRSRVRIGLTWLITVALGVVIAVEVPHPNATLMGAVVVGAIGLVYLVASPRLEISVLLLAIYLGMLDGPVKLLSGGGNTVSALRDVLILAVCIGALVRQLARNEPMSLPPLAPWVLGFVLIVLLMALNPNTVGFLKIAAGYRQQLEWVPFFFFGYLLIRSKQRLRKLFIILGVIAAANALASAYQVRLTPQQLAAWGPGYSEKVLGTGGVSGTTFSAEGAGRVRPLALGSDIGYGGGLGVIALPGVLMLLATSPPGRRWVWGVMTLLVLAGIGLSLSRTAIIGAVVALAAFAALSFSAGERVGKLLAALFVIMILAFPIGALVVSAEGSAIFSRYSSIAPESAAESTTNYKEISLSQIPNDIANDPFGFGLGTAGAASGFGGKTTVTLEGHGFSSETEFNFIVNELGLPGLLMFVGLILTLASLVLRRLPRIADVDMRIGLAAVFSSVTGLVIMGFAGAFTAGQGGGSYFWLAAGIAAFWLAGPQRDADGEPLAKPAHTGEAAA